MFLPYPAILFSVCFIADYSTAGVTVVQIEEDWFSRGSAFWGYGLWLFNLLVNFVVLLVLQLFLKDSLQGIVRRSYGNTYKVIGAGLIYLFGIPLIAVFSILSVLGLPFGILLLLVFVLSLWFGDCLAALLLTHYLNSRNEQSWSFWTLILLSLAIVTIIDLAILFPIIGVLGYLVLLAITFGMLTLFFWESCLNTHGITK